MKLEAKSRLTAAPSFEELTKQLEKLEERELTYKEFMAWVEAAPAAKLVKYMEDDSRRNRKSDLYALCFPSGFAFADFKKPYPGKLAQALVKTSSQESISDVLNQYYSRDRKLSAEALDVFMKNINSMKYKDFLDQLTGSEADTDAKVLKIGGEEIQERLPNGWSQAPNSIINKMLARCPKKVQEVLLGEDI